MQRFLSALLLILILLSAPGPASAEHPALPFERSVAASATECAAGWTKAGRMAFARCGTGFTYFVVEDAEEQAIANGGIFTHSHPSMCCGPLASGDVDFAVKWNLREIRAVHLVGSTITVYSLARRGPAWPQIDLARIGYNPGLQKPNEPMCGWADLAWKKAARIYGLAYSVHQETLILK